MNRTPSPDVHSRDQKSFYSSWQETNAFVTLLFSQHSYYVKFGAENLHTVAARESLQQESVYIERGTSMF